MELDSLLSDEGLAGAVLVLGNKIDIPQAAGGRAAPRAWPHQLHHRQGQRQPEGYQHAADRGVHVQVVKRMGYGEGIKWMSQYID